MQPGDADAADVHAGALADGLEAFENGDVFCGVGAGPIRTGWIISRSNRPSTVCGRTGPAVGGGRYVSLEAAAIGLGAWRIETG